MIGARFGNGRLIRVRMVLGSDGLAVARIVRHNYKLQVFLPSMAKRALTSNRCSEVPPNSKLMERIRLKV